TAVQAAGNYLVQAPTTSAANTITPTTSGVVGLTVKGTNTGTLSDVLDIYNSNATPTLQDFFDKNGSLNVGQAIQPTANNTIDLGLTTAAFKDVYSANFDTGTTTTALTIGTTNAASVSLGKNGITTTNNGALTVSQLLTGNGGATIGGGAIALTGNAASSFTTSSGALTLQGFAGTTVSTPNTGTASTNSSAVTIQSGNATGTTSNSGNLTIDSGTATGTTGTVSIGTANASAVTLGHSGITTTNNGALTVSQLLTASGGITVAANQNFTMNSGTGTFSQTFSNSVASSAHSISITNNNTGGAGVAIQGINLTPTNNNPTSGTNTLNVENFAAGSGTSGTAVTNGINFA